MHKFCDRNNFAKPHRLPHAVAIGPLLFGFAILVYLLAAPFLSWWLALVGVAALAHMIIVKALARSARRRLQTRDRPATKAVDVLRQPSHTLHNPRTYDWLAKMLTFGGEARFRRRTVALAGILPGSVVLDIGCGTGTLLVEIASRIGTSVRLHGVDKSPEMLAHARRKAAARGIKVEMHEGSSDQLPFPDASFDVVFSTLMFHHLPEPMQLATTAEMCRVLRPGGKIIIIDMQRRKQISPAFSLLEFVHTFRPHATIPNWRKIEELMALGGLQVEGRRGVWGETVCALVGRSAADN